VLKKRKLELKSQKIAGKTPKESTNFLIHKGGKNRPKNTGIYQVLRAEKSRFADPENKP